MPPQQRTLYHLQDEDSSFSEISPGSTQRRKLSLVAVPTSCNKNQQPKKRFRFALSKNVIHPIPHIDDLSDEEVFDTWYQRHDYDNIKKNMVPLIKKMMKGEKVKETDRQTIRGLEFRTRDGAIRRQHNKFEAMTAVMDEQDRQYEFAGYTNDHLLAKVYKTISDTCQQEAHQLALGDVDPAVEHCGDTRFLVQQVRLLHKSERNKRRNLPPVRKQSRSNMDNSNDNREQTLLRSRLEAVALA